MSELNGREKTLYSMLSLNEDTEIVEIFAALYPGEPAPPIRNQQQKIGTYITRANRKLEKVAIRPGVARYSYRLYFTQA